LSKLKIAIVGCGRIGNRHAEHANRLAELTAVCDIKENVAKETAAIYHCQYYRTIDDLLNLEKNVELISVCTPNGLHAEHTIKALRAKKHVLCEKPMAITVKDCERMICEAERANKRLFIVKQNRFNPPVIAVKKVIDGGRLGRILSVQLNCFWNRDEEYYISSDWKGTKSMDGGTLFTQFSHFIDLLYWIVGDVAEAYSITKNMIHNDCIEFEDTGVVSLLFDSGALGTIHFTVNSFAKNMEGSITIFGERGTVKVGGQYLNILEYQCIDSHVIADLQESMPPNNYGRYVGSMSNHDKVYENVIDVLKNGGTISTNALEGLKTVQIIERIYSAGRKDGRGYENT
jgi:UDP-N-acetyl-2-amino-2-deoxyglucuronate dehydrogenase